MLVRPLDSSDADLTLHRAGLNFGIGADAGLPEYGLWQVELPPVKSQSRRRLRSS